jgi:hypothetical protein
MPWNEIIMFKVTCSNLQFIQYHKLYFVTPHYFVLTRCKVCLNLTLKLETLYSNVKDTVGGQTMNFSFTPTYSQNQKSDFCV